MDSHKEIVLNFKRESFLKLINTVIHPTKPIEFKSKDWNDV